MKIDKLKKIVIICSLFLGCSKHKKNVVKNENILKWCFFNDIVSLDPSKCRDIISWALLKQIFEPLLSIDKEGNLMPCLAKKWFSSSDHKTFTLVLKKNVKFHDGTVMTAKDVKESFERTCGPFVKSLVALQYLGDIEGAEEFYMRKTEQIKGIKILTDDKIQINLIKPTSYFLKKLTNPITGVMGKATRYKKEFLKPEDLIGTGPFKLKAQVPKHELDLTSYADYHGGKVKIDGINIKILPDPEQTLNYFKEGKLDICDISFKQANVIKKDPILKEAFKEIDAPAVNFLVFNQSHPLFSKKLFRQAIHTAINRNLIVEALDNTIVPSRTLIPKGILSHRNYLSDNSFNIKKAKALLIQSGIKNLSELNLKLYTISQMPLFNSIAENIVMQLKTNLNLNITIQPLARGTFMEKVAKKELGMMLYAWTAVIMDPSNFLYDLLCSKSKLNYFSYKNSKADKMILKASSIDNIDIRRGLYRQAEDIILEDTPIIPICLLKRLILVNKRVKGIEFNPMEIMPFRNVSVNEN